MEQVIIVSSNSGKLKEYQDKLKPIECIPYQSLFSDLEIEETGATFKENAYLKAMAVYKKSHLPCIADDSGLIVEALPNELGVHSKRFSKEMTDEANNQLLLHKLKNINNRKAYFHTTICLIEPGKEPRYYEGNLYGHIIDAPRGNHGFGYDPLFQVDELNITLAECTLSQKNLISHRSKALDQLIKDIKS
jgi:XTP/dITP diphosphohydrolase